MPTKKPLLSVFIIAKNEAVRLPAVLRALKPLTHAPVHAEVLVIDSGSTDGTQKIAQKHGAKMHHRDWNGYGAQKSYGEGLCTAPWVLNLDADEVPDEAMLHDIARVVQQPFNTQKDAGIYGLKRQNMPLKLLLKAQRTGGGWGKMPAPWGTPKEVWYRLYRTEITGFTQSTVHDNLPLPKGAKTAVLKGRLKHYTIVSYEEFYQKVGAYAALQAQDRAAKGKVPAAWFIPWAACAHFWKLYLLRRLCVFGLEGYVQAKTIATSRMIRDLETRRLAGK